MFMTKTEKMLILGFTVLYVITIPFVSDPSTKLCFIATWGLSATNYWFKHRK